ncbi:hypothetical protein FQA47_008657 [Oryzias melastigma]|uniref:Uncharacterized protein n=1 Tax=Oryzias melastigma TaxID=30732 RepID=A0A834FBV6_ORYME|nr:hypothetical protein FQA47_008657 [Oryzias melastigma]
MKPNWKSCFSPLSSFLRLSLISQSSSAVATASLSAQNPVSCGICICAPRYSDPRGRSAQADEPKTIAVDKRDLDLSEYHKRDSSFWGRKKRKKFLNSSKKETGTSVRKRRAEGPPASKKEEIFYAQQHQETRLSPLLRAAKLSLLVCHSDCHFTKSAS